VEDFINAELVMQLYPLLQAEGYQVYPVREMDKGAGNHASGHPWWQMGSSEYARNLGFPGSVWGQYFSQGYNRNIVTPPELSNAIGADILVSIHNNGGRGTGTETWYDTSNGYGNESRKLANLIQSTLIERLKGQYDPGWHSRGVKGSPGGYGEIRRFDGPAVIVELAFMDTLSDNNALQDPAFQAIAMQAISDAVVTYLGGSVDPVKPVQFSGNVSSRLFTDQGGGRINLEVCADNLPGQTVQAQLSRPGKSFSVVSQTASGRCVTFWDLSGAETPLGSTTYTTRAALNQPPNPGWGVPCYASTGGRGLCDAVSTSSSLTNTFTNGSSSPSINANTVDLQVCADNLPGHTVYVQMWRDAAMGYPARTWNVSKYASGTCVNFGDLDGVGGTFENVDYYTVAALEPIGAGEAAQKQTGCYVSSGQTRLCDHVSRTVTTNVFVNGGSTPDIDADAVSLQICGDNLAGRMVYVQMWRDAAEGYPARTWNFSRTASSSCITFNDIDGSGGTFANVDYYTVAALEPLGSTEAAQKRTSCYWDSGETRLCDRVSRTVVDNKFVYGGSTLSITTTAVNLEVCGDNLAGRTVYVQMWRDAAQGYPANTWNVSRVASSTCVTFSDLDGAGNTFANVDYYTVAALEPIGPTEAAQKRDACYWDTGETRLCDKVRRSVASNVFVNGVSYPSITTTAVNLQVCGDNLAGKTVYVQMWRDAAQGYAARTWNVSRVASGTCVTFSDLDGSGNTFDNVDYYTVAALEPIGATEAAQKRTACYWNTGETRLCDRVSR
jgi:N-acetylmuramoyl-L-alanine amidase